MRRLAGRRGRLPRWLPLPGWGKGRDMPAPTGRTFFEQYQARQDEQGKGR
jgi:L-lactate dehydrogenase complex protein LldF